jgi:hypothetical protein
MVDLKNLSGTSTSWRLTMIHEIPKVLSNRPMSTSEVVDNWGHSLVFGLGNAIALMVKQHSTKPLDCLVSLTFA